MEVFLCLGELKIKKLRKTIQTFSLVWMHLSILDVHLIRPGKVHNTKCTLDIELMWPHLLCACMWICMCVF